MVWLWHLEPIPRLILALCGGGGEEIRCVEGRPAKKGEGEARRRSVFNLSWPGLNQTKPGGTIFPFQQGGKIVATKFRLFLCLVRDFSGL